MEVVNMPATPVIGEVPDSEVIVVRPGRVRPSVREESGPLGDGDLEQLMAELDSFDPIKVLAQGEVDLRRARFRDVGYDGGFLGMTANVGVFSDGRLMVYFEQTPFEADGLVVANFGYMYTEVPGAQVGIATLNQSGVADAYELRTEPGQEVPIRGHRPAHPEERADDTTVAYVPDPHAIRSYIRTENGLEADRTLGGAMDLAVRAEPGKKLWIAELIPQDPVE